MKIDFLVAFVELGLSGYFFYRIFKGERTASNGVAAGAFLVIGFIHLVPLISGFFARLFQ